MINDRIYLKNISVIRKIMYNGKVSGVFFHAESEVIYHGLTIKQKKFADEYIISGNATKAAIEAGYSEKYANTNVSKLLQNTTIKTYIDDRLAEIDSKKVADQKEILQYLTSIMRGEQKEQTLKSEGSDFGQKIIDIDMGAKDRIKAAELLGKRYSMWTDKMKVESNEVVVIKDDI